MWLISNPIPAALSRRQQLRVEGIPIPSPNRGTPAAPQARRPRLCAPQAAQPVDDDRRRCPITRPSTQPWGLVTMCTLQFVGCPVLAEAEGRGTAC